MVQFSCLHQESMLTTSGWGYENMPAICSDASCCGGNCVGICAYGIQLTNSCGGSAGGSYSRLCPCGTEAEVTTTLSCREYLTRANCRQRIMSLLTLQNKITIVIKASPSFFPSPLLQIRVRLGEPRTFQKLQKSTQFIC